MPRVVVGVDDSLAGLQALRFAAAEARRRGVLLRAVRAWQYTTPWYGADGQCRADMIDAAAMTLIRAFQSAMGGLPGDIVVEAVAVEGPPAGVLVGQATEPDDLLVVGRSGRHLTGRPHVDVHCVRTATCPVVTVAAPLLVRDRGAGGLRRDVVSAAEAIVRDAAAAPPPERPTQPA
jgi:nucleotide-binding universal stress UspA family protein